jgi:hypothetical protein
VALAATVVWEIQPAGTHADDANGGGFDAGVAAPGTDYTQGAGLTHVDYTSLNSVGGDNTMIRHASKFTAADLGNTIHITGGTNAIAGWYTLKSLDSDDAKLDRDWTTGSTTDGTGILGGSLATLGGLGAIFQTAAQATAGMKAYMLHGTYSLTQTTVNISGGALDLDASQMDGKYFVLKGYDDAYGRTSFVGTRPVIDCATVTPANAHVVTVKGTAGHCQYAVFLEIDGDDLTVTGIFGSSLVYDNAISCVVHHCDVIGISQCVTTLCHSHTNVGDGFDTVFPVLCRSSGNGGAGFDASVSPQCCIADGNAGSGFSLGYGTESINCVAYNNGVRGFTSNHARLINCIAYSNGTYEYYGTYQLLLINCASGDVTSGRTGGVVVQDIGAVTLTADPFTDKAAGDFSLNNTAGGGALCRAAGISVPSQTGYSDVGSVQHADPAAGGGGPLVGASALVSV